MKNHVLIAFASLGLLCAIPASATTISYASSVTFDNKNHAYSGVASESWNQAFTSLAVAGSTVSSATLTFYTRHAIGGNDFISVNGTRLGVLGSANDTGNDIVATSFTLSGADFGSLALGMLPELDLQLDYNAQGNQNKDALTLESATLSLQYASSDSGDSSQIPSTTVPEPVSTALFGLGLACLALARKRAA